MVLVPEPPSLDTRGTFLRSLISRISLKSGCAIKTISSSWVDNSRITRLHGIDLTSVDQDARGLGQEAGQLALRLLRDPAEARRLGEAAQRRWSEGYRPEVMARALEALFTQLVAERRARSSRSPLRAPTTSP